MLFENYCLGLVLWYNVCCYFTEPDTSVLFIDSDMCSIYTRTTCTCTCTCTYIHMYMLHMYMLHITCLHTYMYVYVCKLLSNRYNV